MNIKFVFFLLFIFPIFCEANEYLSETHYKLQWRTGNGAENNVDIFLNDNKINVKATDGVSGEKLWSLSDYVSSCDLDLELDIIPDSLEVADLFNDGNDVVLFAYKIGCVGGIDPVDVKYFAFYKGQKYALRGQEIFISEDGVDEGYHIPVPSYNLKNNEKLFEYMQKKWPSIAAKILF